MRRKVPLLRAAPVFAFFITASSLYLTLHHLATQSPYAHELAWHDGSNKLDGAHISSLQGIWTSGSPSEKVLSVPPSAEVLSEGNITRYLDEILSRRQTDLPNLACPAPSESRYDFLRIGAGSRYSSSTPGSVSGSESRVRYFFALDLRQALPVLPRLIGSIIQAARFLGPEHCALSIVQGNSDDGTFDVLAALRPEIVHLGLKYFLQASDLDPSQGDRIQKLAELRNLALKPLIDQRLQRTFNPRAEHHEPENIRNVDDDEDITIIFLNDVAPCPDDILELLLQKIRLGADMTCAMDWTYVGRDPTFYDVWVARGINGDSFFEIPPDGNWDSAWDLFWNDQDTQARLYAHQPFQVFSCWNGAVAFTAKPLLSGRDPRGRIAFRAPDKDRGECEQGEPQLFCKDMWRRGYGKIAVVPAVNLEYSVEKARMIKELKGFTADNVHGREGAEEQRIDWLPAPEEVKCMPVWEKQSWRPWDESLAY